MNYLLTVKSKEGKNCKKIYCLLQSSNNKFAVTADSIVIESKSLEDIIDFINGNLGDAYEQGEITFDEQELSEREIKSVEMEMTCSTEQAEQQEEIYQNLECFG